MDYKYDDWNNLIESFLDLNTKINLSSLRTAEQVWQKHILDSLELLKVFSFESWQKIIDIGTWSGFPLLPLAKMYPENIFVGVESIRKKTDAVNQLAALNTIQNIKVHRSRIEDFQWNYDVLIARAVAYSDVLINRSYHLVKKGGYFVFYKMYSDQEHDDILLLCKKRSLILEKDHRYHLFEWDVQRVIYILKKQ